MTHDAQVHTILLLGTGGRLGHLLRAAWAPAPQDGVRLICQSRQAPSGPEIPGLDSIIWAPDEPADTLPACDTVIALWGQTAGDETALAANAMLAHHSRRVALACGARSCLHISSAAIYGPMRNATEDNTPPAPVTAYGRAKYDMELQVAGFADDPVRHCCLRLVNVVGADSLAGPLQGTAPVCLDRFADGSGPRRSYIGAGDLLKVLIALATLAPDRLPPVLNVAAQHSLAMQDLIRAAGKSFEWRDAPTSAVPEVTLDTRNLARLLPGLELMTTADQMITEWQKLTRTARDRQR